jgi:hypothetical protein
MHINVQDFIAKAGLTEPFYPGKRVVRSFVQPGEYKSHCIVYDWRHADKIRIELRAGLSGKQLEPSELAKYPVSLQTATFFEIDVPNGTLLRVDDEDDSEEDRGRVGSSSGSGGFKPKKKELSSLSFSLAAEGQIANEGTLTRMVVMGMEIAKEAYAKVCDKFFAQVDHVKIVATDLVAAAGKMITKYTPPAFLKAKGDENAIYKYDRMKNETMFAGAMP